ncbi:MAG: EAL domain-containing protein [Bordetella sp.]|uniref:EAL domain-containing protein n=1 Tax=Bordetella sp. TaxID=28081 RepID=UPI003F7BC18B
MILTRRARRLLLVCLLAVLAVALPFAATVYAAYEISIQRYQDRVRAMSEDVLQHMDRTARQMANALQALSASSDGAPCSEQRLDAMRRLVLSSNQIIDVGMAEGNRLLCSSFGNKGFDLGPPTYVSQYGLEVRTSLHDPLLPAAPLRSVTDVRSGATAIVHEDDLLDVPESASDMSIALVAVSQQLVITSRGRVDSRWLHIADQAPRALKIVDDYLVSVVRSDAFDYAAVAAVPLSRIEAGTVSNALMLSPLGLCIVLALLYILSLFARKQSSMPALIRMAIAKREFSLVYQPIVDLRSRAIVGAEALIRWRTEDGSFINPDIFIPIAEQHHLITQVTDCVLALIALQMGQLLRAQSSFYVAVNLSADDLIDPALPIRLQRWMADMGVDPRRIHIEATERVFMDNDTARRNLAALRSYGISTAIDDFGTGYSSLAYLTRLELDCLKIDKAFVDTIETQSVTSHVVAHIIEMAKSLGLRMVAEGVETEAQSAYLQKRGVRYAQGWLFSKAVPAAGLQALMSRAADDGPAASA